MNITKYLALVAGAATMVACADLDTAPAGGTVTADQKSEVVADDPTRAEAAVNGVFAQMSQYMPNYDMIGSRHNDFGYAAIMLLMDGNGHDVVSSNNGYNWFSSPLTYSDRVYTSNEAIIIWNTLYQQIFSANNVAASISVDTEDSLTQFYLAQGLAARAFNYWVLAQIFQFNYVGHESAPCVPIITDENSVTVALEGAPRATVAEVYAQIMSDLDTTIELLGKTSTRPADKRYVSTAVAYGLRARVNLTMQKWADALADANAAIAAFSGRPYTIAECADSSLQTSFWNASDAPIMWAEIVEVTDDVVQSGLLNWPSHLHSLCYGYNSYSGGFQISKKLFNTIPDTDVRKGWWLDENGESEHIADNAAAVSYLAAAGFVPYTNVKFGPDQAVIGQSDNANDIPLMRIEEMYLIKAEAETMSGNPAAGKQTLESFVCTYRDPAYTCNASSAADVQEEIFRQRRIELWGEGINWFDMMRLNKAVDRRGAGYIDEGCVVYIPAGSNIMLYRIPQSEIEANLQISEGDNNPIDELSNYRVADVE